MTPKEKAQQLVDRFREIPPSSPYTGIGDGEAKECAKVLVSELINHSKEMAMVYDLSFDESSSFYAKVKQEIINLLNNK
jgi:hypothetical protein